MTKIKVTEVVYEALGKEVKTYTDLQDPVEISMIVKMIVDTAHVSSIRMVTVTGRVFKENNLSPVEAWYRKIKPKIIDDDE